MNSRQVRIWVPLGIGLIVFMSGCQPSNAISFPSPTKAAMTEIPPSIFRIIGYAPEWDSVIAEIQFEHLTHINYAFLLPKADGSFENLEQPEKLKALVSEAHQRGVKVLISIGGWGYDAQFEALAAMPSSRNAFVQGAVQFASEFELDGLDIDWEYPDPGSSSENFLALMAELREALPQGKLLTAAVVSKGSLAEGIPAEVFGIVDFLNLMVYDASKTDHSPYSLAVEALDYWSRRGLPAEKTVLGVPFYGRPVGIPYRQLVQADPAAAMRDESEFNGQRIYYNGIPTLQRKTKLALERASGIMIWELAHDTSDDISLLNAIYQTVTNTELP